MQKFNYLFMRLFYSYSFCALLFFFSECTTKESFSDESNLGFELTSSNKPLKWALNSNSANKEYFNFLDSTNRKNR